MNKLRTGIFCNKIHYFIVFLLFSLWSASPQNKVTVECVNNGDLTSYPSSSPSAFVAPSIPTEEESLLEIPAVLEPNGGSGGTGAVDGSISSSNNNDGDKIHKVNADGDSNSPPIVSKVSIPASPKYGGGNSRDNIAAESSLVSSVTTIFYFAVFAMIAGGAIYFYKKG